MKHVTVLIGITVLFFVGPVLLAAETEPESAGTSDAMMQNMQNMQNTHEHMQKMQEQMKSIHATDDPEERKALMHEHMQAMQEGMPCHKKHAMSTRHHDMEQMSEHQGTQETSGE